jgi:internalin A
MKDLAKLQQLLSLDLGTTDVSEQGLKELASLQQLQMLNLGNPLTMTDAGLKELANLQQCGRSTRVVPR